MTTPTCPRCGSSDTIPVLYGMPTDEVAEEVRRGELALGGCMVWPGQPSHRCKSCRNDFRVPADPDDGGEDTRLNARGRPAVALGKRFRAALELASELHARQFRKGTTIPYVSHLLSVCALVLERGGSEDQAIAALLHDAVEDHGDEVNIHDIDERFGRGVAAIVDDCTDSWTASQLDWRERKEAYIEHLANARPVSLLVSYCDKLHNARTIFADLMSLGDAVWERSRGGRDGMLWYCRALVETFRARGHDVSELDEVVSAIERAASRSST